MPSTYTLNNGIELIATGEQSGTWGDTTNTNMSLLDTALDGQVTVTLASAGTSGSPNTLPISDGAVSDGRNRMVIFNDGADLGATAYVQLTPNDAEKIVYIRNALSGSRSIIVFQGTYNASNDYEIPAGTTAVVYFNGGGTGAVAANVFNNAYFDSLRLGSVSVTAILDEDDMSSDSATSLATQQSIKAYVDSQVGTVDTLAEILANGNTTGGTDISVSSGDDITFADSSKAIFGDSGDLQIYHDGSNSYIKDLGTGDLLLSGNTGVQLQSDAGENMITTAANGAVSLFYDASAKLATTATGIDVTGTVTADGLTVDGQGTFTTSDNSAQVTLISTDTDALVGPQLNLWRNSGTGTNGDLIGQITFTGEDSVGSTNTFATIYGVADQTDNGAEDGSIHFQTLINGVLADRLEINSAGNSVFTGTVTADGLTASNVSGTTLIQAVGVDSNGFADVEIKSTGTSGASRLYFSDTAGQSGSIKYSHSSDAMLFSTAGASRLNIASNGDISFYEDTGTTAKFFWDASAEALGIGTTSPAVPLDIDIGTGNNAIYGRSSDQYCNIGLTDSVGSVKLGSNNGALFFETGGDTSFASLTERMRIDSSGNVGIGTSSPNSTLEVAGAARFTGTVATLNLLRTDSVSPSARIRMVGSDNADKWEVATNYLVGGAGLEFNYAGSNLAFMSTAGNLGLGVTPSAWASSYKVAEVGYSAFLLGSSGTTENLTLGSNWLQNSSSTNVYKNNGYATFYQQASGAHAWYTAVSGTAGNTISFTQAMTLDASGNLLVGRTSVGTTGTGHSIRGGDSAVFARENGEVGIFSRNSSDGEIIRFDSNSVAGVGSIGAYNSVIYFAGPNANAGGFRIDSSGSNGVIIPTTNTGANRDAAVDLGYSSGGTNIRFKDLYLSGVANVGSQIKFNAHSGYDERTIGLDSTGLYVYNVTDSRYDLSIDGSGNLLVGTTTITGVGGSSSPEGVVLDGNNAQLTVGTSSDVCATFNRQTTDGAIVQFRKDGTTVGLIGVGDGDNLYITGSAGSTKGLIFNDNSILPAANGYNPSDATTLLGSTSYRFTDLYLSGGVKIGTSGRTTYTAGGFYDNAASGNNIGVVTGGGHVFLSDGNGTATDNVNDFGSTNRRIKDIYVGGGVYLGGIVSSNKLDDYEEGTFTPTIEGTTTAGTGTYVYQFGRYTKVGDLVHVQVTIGWSAHTGTGNMRLANLPFTSLAGAQGQSGLTIAYANGVTFTSGDNLALYVGAGSTSSTFNSFNGGGSLNAVSLDTAVTEIIIAGTYKAA